MLPDLLNCCLQINVMNFSSALLVTTVFTENNLFVDENCMFFKLAFLVLPHG